MVPFAAAVVKFADGVVAFVILVVDGFTAVVGDARVVLALVADVVPDDVTGGLGVVVVGALVVFVGGATVVVADEIGLFVTVIEFGATVVESGATVVGFGVVAVSVFGSFKLFVTTGLTDELPLFPGTVVTATVVGTALLTGGTVVASE